VAGVPQPWQLAGGIHAAPGSPQSASRWHSTAGQKQGVFVGKGQCPCVMSCRSGLDQFVCSSTAECVCFETAEGTSFCATGEATSEGCSTTAECAIGTTCIVQRGCPDAGTRCRTAAECPPSQGCLRRKCQHSTCAVPCPI
jgi:hypothetical protein